MASAQRDIDAGQKALAKMNSTDFERVTPVGERVPKKKGKKPFERNPNRNLNSLPVIVDE